MRALLSENQRRNLHARIQSLFVSGGRKEAANRIGVRPSTLSNWLRGVHGHELGREDAITSALQLVDYADLTKKPEKFAEQYHIELKYISEARDYVASKRAKPRQRATPFPMTGEHTASIVPMTEPLGDFLLNALNSTTTFFQVTRLSCTFVIPNDAHVEFRNAFTSRIKDGLLFKKVEVIFNKECLIDVMKSMHFFRGYNFYIRYYPRPPQFIPIINTMSFDNRMFMLGGYYRITDQPPLDRKAMSIAGSEVAEFIDDYWQIVWGDAFALNASKRPNWDRVRDVARGLKIEDQIFEKMVGEAEEISDDYNPHAV